MLEDGIFMFDKKKICYCVILMYRFGCEIYWCVKGVYLGMIIGFGFEVLGLKYIDEVGNNVGEIN